MVLNLKVKIPLKDVKVSRVVLISGLLTFLYCIEFCIGIRTIYYTFKVWNDATYESQDRPVTWTLCVACLFTATISFFSVNVLSAIWEQKQLQERGKEKSAIRFAFHVVVGGMIWRYISLWCIKTKDFQKKEALLLTMTKFLFTQTFTVPMVIVHVSVLDLLDEVIYDVCSIFCISTNLILTCTMFSWCCKEMEELKKWDFQTMDFVPLIFQSEPAVDAEQTDRSSSNPADKESQSKEKNKLKRKNIELMIIKIIVFFQTFGFSLGRLLALGILLKLAGIYAVSIMFLQLLISVIYLKFQAPTLVSDSLPKWRQLSRLAFMSYILIFEWHLKRDPKTGYDLSSKMKHIILYYCVATIESVFYLVTWAITTSYALKSEESVFNKTQNKFCRTILVMGSMALVFSLILQLVLLFWRSRKMSVFFYSVRRQCERTKLRLSKYGGCKEEIEKNKESPKRLKIDISSPIPIKKNEDTVSDTENRCELEKHNSYRDLREPLDDEIDIYFHKCDTEKYSDSDVGTDTHKHAAKPDKARENTSGKTFVKTIDQQVHLVTNSLEKKGKISPRKNVHPAAVEITESNTSIDRVDENNEKPPEKSLKSKLTILSDNVSEKLGKVSSASRKVAGSMKEQIQKRKEQFQNFRNNSASDSTKTEIPTNPESLVKTPITGKDLNHTEHISSESNEVSEGFFIGDSRGYQEESLQSVKSFGGKHTVSFSDETISEPGDRRQTEDGPFPASDVTHKNGGSPCLCYVCKTLGEGRFRRRRSSSMPSADRKNKDEEDENNEIKTLPRNVSNPIIPRNDCKEVTDDRSYKDKSVVLTPGRFSKANFDFNRLSSENSIEHYV